MAAMTGLACVNCILLSAVIFFSCRRGLSHQGYGIPVASIRDALYDVIFDDQVLLAATHDKATAAVAERGSPKHGRPCAVRQSHCVSALLSQTSA
jgi:hypothetical protein